MTLNLDFRVQMFLFPRWKWQKQKNQNNSSMAPMGFLPLRSHCTCITLVLAGLTCKIYGGQMDDRLVWRGTERRFQNSTLRQLHLAAVQRNCLILFTYNHILRREHFSSTVQNVKWKLNTTEKQLYWNKIKPRGDHNNNMCTHYFAVLLFVGQSVNKIHVCFYLGE